jgi:hypothetical protein
MPPLDFQSLDEDDPVDVGTLRQALAQQSQQVTEQVAGMLEQATAQQSRALEDLARRVRNSAPTNGSDEQDPRDQLARAAKELGLSPEQLERAATQAKRQELKEQLRTIAEEDPELVAEIWDNGARLCLGDDYDEDEPKPSSSKSKSGTRGNGKTKPPAADSAPVTDSEPEHVHWAERSLGDWFK